MKFALVLYGSESTASAKMAAARTAFLSALEKNGASVVDAKATECARINVETAEVIQAQGAITNGHCAAWIQRRLS